MKFYYPPSSDNLPGVYQDCPDKKEELINFFHNGVLAAAKVNYHLSNTPDGPILTSHLTGEHCHLDHEDNVAKYANLTELNMRGKEETHNYANCSLYKKKARIEHRAKMILRYELENKMIQLVEVLSPPQYIAAAPAVTPSRNAQGGTTNNDETAQNLKIRTKKMPAKFYRRKF